MIFACDKEQKLYNVSINSSLGCVNDGEITDIPYLTTYSEMISVVTIDDKSYNYDLYLDNGITITTDLETNNLLIIKKDNKFIKQYLIVK